MPLNLPEANIYTEKTMDAAYEIYGLQRPAPNG